MRTQAREHAFQLIFERLFVKNNYTFDEEFFSSLKKEEDKIFAQDIVKSFEEHREELTQLISSHLIGYEIDRVYKIDLALMYLSLTEIKYIGTPFQVAINETLTIAKKYSTIKSSKFINGVLSSILKDIKI
ncbi:MAG: transcription antitermination factor NusB [Clostridia bacterium]|jgi:N utilization substance protein B|nr:transcription antitermination factor NusB [Clostridia bacterium]